jgi:hypothetical protein
LHSKRAISVRKIVRTAEDDSGPELKPRRRKSGRSIASDETCGEGTSQPFVRRQATTVPATDQRGCDPVTWQSEQMVHLTQRAELAYLDNVMSVGGLMKAIRAWISFPAPGRACPPQARVFLHSLGQRRHRSGPDGSALPQRADIAACLKGHEQTSSPPSRSPRRYGPGASAGSRNRHPHCRA